MQQWVASRLGLNDAAAQLHRIVLHESLQDGIETTAILHVPSEALNEGIKKWLSGFIERRRMAGSGVALEWDFEEPRTWKGSHKRHWSLVQLLWRGVDASLRQGSTLLVDHLGVTPSVRRPAGDMDNRRLAMSRSLGIQARNEYSENFAPAFSAWQEGAWDKLFVGWELRVFEMRAAAFAKHKRDLAALDSALADARDSLTEKSLGSRRDKLIEAWKKREDSRHFQQSSGAKLVKKFDS